MNQTRSLAPTRRDFAQALAVLAAAAAAPVAAQEAAVPDVKAYAEAVETIIRYRFGKQLTAQQVQTVRNSLVARRISSDLLKLVELANGDDPIVAFRADLP